MARFLLIALLLVLTVSDADARRRHHRHWHRAPVVMIGPGMDMPREMRGREMRGLYRPREMRGLDMPREMRRSSSFIPADWKLQPDDPNFSGRRYMAPDGSAWLALYSAPADKVNVAVHLKNVAFADGEEITYLRGARDGLAVSGLKGDRVYYRKAARPAAARCGATSRSSIRQIRSPCSTASWSAPRRRSTGSPRRPAAAICSRIRGTRATPPSPRAPDHSAQSLGKDRSAAYFAKYEDGTDAASRCRSLQFEVEDPEGDQDPHRSSTTPR